MFRKPFRFIFFVILAVVFWLMAPGNHYLRRALIHLTPNIDDYKIFDNRVVRAANPLPWDISPVYNSVELPEKHLRQFDKYKTVAYLIVKDKQIQFEKYWDGYNEKSLSNSFSMAKSIVSLLAGCAIDEGAIESVDEKVSKYLPWITPFNGRELTIKDLLTMSAGINWDEQYTSAFSITTKAYYGDNLDEIVRSLNVVEMPGERFNYQSGVTQLLARVVSIAINGNISDYASRKLWTPMGAEKSALWMLDKVNGEEKAYCCFNSNARDFARFGQLILNNGSWNGKQLISEKYIKEATSPATYLYNPKTDRPLDTYGYQWWLMTHRGEQVIYMRGIYGQYVFAVPSKNMVVVRLGHKRSDEKTADDVPVDVLTWLDAAWDIDEDMNARK